MIKLIFPSIQYQRELLQFKKDLLKSKSPFHGTGEIEKYPIDKWIERCDDHRSGLNLPAGYVPATLFMAVRTDNNKLVGLIQIRHSLNENLFRIGGNIGYVTAGDERIEVFSKEMLRLCLHECKKLGMNKILMTLH